LGCLSASIRLSPRKDSFRGDFAFYRAPVRNVRPALCKDMLPAPERLARHSRRNVRLHAMRSLCPSYASSLLLLPESGINLLTDSTLHAQNNRRRPTGCLRGRAGQLIYRQCHTVGDTRLQGWAMCIWLRPPPPCQQIAHSHGRAFFHTSVSANRSKAPVVNLLHLSRRCGACRSPLGFTLHPTACLQHVPTKTTEGGAHAHTAPPA